MGDGDDGQYGDIGTRGGGGAGCAGAVLGRAIAASSCGVAHRADATVGECVSYRPLAVPLPRVSDGHRSQFPARLLALHPQMSYGHSTASRQPLLAATVGDNAVGVTLLEGVAVRVCVFMAAAWMPPTCVSTAVPAPSTAADAAVFLTLSVSHTRGIQLRASGDTVVDLPTPPWTPSVAAVEVRSKKLPQSHIPCASRRSSPRPSRVPAA